MTSLVDLASAAKRFLRTCTCFGLRLLFITTTLLSVACRAEEPKPPVRIIVLGDSLSAGYGLAAEQAFPAQLEAALREAGWPATVINAGVSGDTTAGGLARLDWALQDEPDVMIIQLGANDALRGLSPDRAEANLAAILTRLHDAGVKPILAGMRAPLNLGHGYTSRFNPIYERLAQKHEVPLYPFFLEGAAGKPTMNLEDGIHPNAEGIAEMVARFMPFLQKHLPR